MKNLMWIMCIVLMIITRIACANDEISVFDNQYKARLYGFSIEVNSRLMPLSNGNYELYFNADSLVGSVTEISQFTWDAQEQTIIPSHYTYLRKGLGKTHEEELTFNWFNHTVVDSKKNTSWPLSELPKVQDSLSYQLQLRQDLLSGKSKFVYSICDGKKTKEYRFEIVGDELLHTPLGDVKTVKLRRSDLKGDRETYAWFAKDFQYLLVRLEQESGGSVYTIYISKAGLNGKEIKHF